MKPYKTLYQRASDEFIVNKSRFIGHAMPAETEEEALAFLREIRETYKDANHNCYAYIIGQNAGIQRYNDDGEPGGTAGLPIIGVLSARGIVNAAVVVTRYFGGILLGAGGLTRAYTKGAAVAVNAAKPVVMVPSDTYLLSVPYPLWDKLNHRFTSLPLRVESTEFAADILVTFQVKKDDTPSVLQAIASATDGRAEALLMQSGFSPWDE